MFNHLRDVAQTGSFVADSRVRDSPCQIVKLIEVIEGISFASALVTATVREVAKMMKNNAQALFL